MNKKGLSAFMLASVALGDIGNMTTAPVERRRPKLIEKKPPKGAKEYFFNESGEFSTEQMRRDECVFVCWAINDKNAIRKFNQFKTLSLI